MYLVEIETKLGKDGVIQLPDKEREATGLHEGDEICLLYLNCATFRLWRCSRLVKHTGFPCRCG